MHINTSIRIRLFLNLTVHTVAGIALSIWRIWQTAPHGRRLRAAGQKFWRIVNYDLSWATDPIEYFSLDGVTQGRRLSQLTGTQRAQRDDLAARRRRRIAVLLRCLGDSPSQVQASLTRDWLQSRTDHPDLLENYLRSRLAERDPAAAIDMIVFGRVCLIGGTWVSVPAAVRGYLANASTYERMLYLGSHLPRRGPRLLVTTEAGPSSPKRQQRRCRCCLPIEA